MTPNRKRRIECEDEVEFTPLSKRINNLHINGNMLDQRILNSQPTTSQWSEPSTSFFQIDQSMTYQAPLTPPEHENINNQYRPSLNENENPYYYYKNKLLFEMHMERLQRSGNSY